jgi:hypothetical protein
MKDNYIRYPNLTTLTIFNLNGDENLNNGYKKCLGTHTKNAQLGNTNYISISTTFLVPPNRLIGFFTT